MIINTGYKEIDYIFSGFKGSNLYVIASRPNMGVTSFILNIILNVSLINRHAHFYSLCESKEKINERLMSIVSGIRFKKDNLTDIESLSLNFSRAILDSLHYSIKSNIKSDVSLIKEYIEMNKSDIDILFIDNLESFNYKEKSKIKNEAGEIVKELKDLSVQYDIPIVLIQSLSKRIELRKNKMPRPTDLNYPDYTLPYFTNVIFLHKESYYKDNYSLVDRESACIVVTDPKITDYRMAYLEFVHNIQRFYSKTFNMYYVDEILKQSNNYFISYDISKKDSINNLKPSDYKEGILECIKDKNIKESDKIELISLYKRWITMSNYAICDIIYLIRDK